MARKSTRREATRERVVPVSEMSTATFAAAAVGLALAVLAAGQSPAHAFTGRHYDNLDSQPPLVPIEVTYMDVLPFGYAGRYDYGYGYDDGYDRYRPPPRLRYRAKKQFSRDFGYRAPRASVGGFGSYQIRRDARRRQPRIGGDLRARPQIPS